MIYLIPIAFVLFTVLGLLFTQKKKPESPIREETIYLIQYILDNCKLDDE
jgi:hypothetical protein